MNMVSGFGMMSNVLTLGVYLLQSYAIYRLAVVRSLPNPIFAFIPFFQLYMLGMIGDSLKYQNYQIDRIFGNIPFAYALPIVSVAGSILRYPLSAMGTLLISFGTVIVYYLIFFHYAPKQRVLFTAISCLPIFATALSIFAMIPFLRGIFMAVSGIIGLLSVITPIAGPLLLLYCIRGYRRYR